MFSGLIDERNNIAPSTSQHGSELCELQLLVVLLSLYHIPRTKIVHAVYRDLQAGRRTEIGKESLPVI